eukprot:g79510.t1
MGHFFLVCSCFYYQRHGVCCSHIFAVRKGNVNIFTDVNVRWFIDYSRPNSDPDSVQYLDSITTTAEYRTDFAVSTSKSYFSQCMDWSYELCKKPAAIIGRARTQEEFDWTVKQLEILFGLLVIDMERKFSVSP